MPQTGTRSFIAFGIAAFLSATPNRPVQVNSLDIYIFPHSSFLKSWECSGSGVIN